MPAASAAACPDGEAFLNVHVRGTVTADRQVCLSEIEAWHDLTDPPYRTRSIPGREPQGEPRPHEALSIRALATELAGEIGGFSADAITFADVPNPRSSYVARLSPSELGASGANGFEDGLMPAVFLDPGFGLFYVRPLRPSLSDTNNRDVFPGFEDGALDLWLHTTGTPLYPTIQVDAAEVRVDKTSSFSVSFDPPTAESLEYRWTFGDGATSDQPAPRHTWKAKGTFRVYLTVGRAGQPAFQSNILEIEVSQSREDPGPEHPGGSGDGGPNNPNTGPDDSEGDDTGATPDPDADPREPNGSPTDSGAAPDGEVPPDASEDPDTSVPVEQGEIAGVLLTGVVGPTGQEESVPLTAPAASEGSTETPLRIPGWLLLAGVVVLLLGAGAVGETQWPARFRRDRTARMPA